jgi:DNA-binding NarL/FixJ family response regulator
MPRAVRVLAVDDQHLARDALARVVRATEGFELVGEATSGAQTLTMLDSLEPDLVLLDVRMPGLDGFETARRIAARDRGTKVVLLSTDDLPGAEAEARAAGAAAFVLKERLACRVLRDLWAGLGAAALERRPGVIR